MNPITIVFLVILLFNSMGRIASDPLNWLMGIVMMLPGIVIGLSFHEFAHGYVSHKLGDPTPKSQGRLTINPLAHIDPIGLLCLMFVGFGWGIPVQINPRYYKHPRRAELIVALAGVVTNLIIAIVAMGIFKLCVSLAPSMLYTGMGAGILTMINYIISINLVLMVFNLLPIPPLDGFNVITQIFNLRNTELYYKVYDKGMWILLVLILFNFTSLILSPSINFLYSLIYNLFF